MSDPAHILHLVFRADRYLCALPVSHIIEILRPLPVEPFAGAPAFVSGLTLIRGAPVPVVDLAAVLAGALGPASRFVIAQTGPRRVAIAVDAVLGLREFPASLWNHLPPLLGEAGAGLIDSVGSLDQELLLTLRTASLVPQAVWDSLGSQET